LAPADAEAQDQVGTAAYEVAVRHCDRTATVGNRHRLLLYLQRIYKQDSHTFGRSIVDRTEQWWAPRAINRIAQKLRDLEHEFSDKRKVRNLFHYC
jgi:hypothetical protein